MTGRAVALMLLLAPTSAEAFVLATTSSGAPLFWQRDRVDYVLAAGGASSLPASERGLEFAALRRAFLTWEEVPGSRLFFVYDGRVDDATVPVEGDGRASVRFYSATVPPELGDAIGVTVVTYDDGSGRIFDADILFNERDFRYSLNPQSSTIDLESVALHEVGHLVGLDHTCGAGGEVEPSCYAPSLPSDPHYPEILGAVMYPLRGAGDPPLRTLTPDDAAGIATVYPAASPLPAPRIDRVLVGDPISGKVEIVLEGLDFASDVGVSVLLDGSTSVSLPGQLTEFAPLRVAATIDLSGASPGCYDVVARNPSGKHGVVFGGLPVGQVQCARLGPRTGGGGGCNVGDGSGTGWGLVGALGVLLGLRRRRSA